jgi:CRISPR-associated protein Cmr6
MKENFYLPKDTFDLKLNESNIENFALRLNKFPKAIIDKGKPKFVIYHKTRKNKQDSIHLINHNFKDSKKTILDFTAKYLFNLNKIQNLNLETSFFKPDWKMIVGLGDSSVYETSITLHHIYGFPYIPGQAVKGIVRNYVITEYFDKDEKKAEKNNSFIKIFGNQSEAGKIIFFDAYPASEPKIDFDIMNVHYPDYYSKTKEPTDDQNPNPIAFLTVKETKFVFSVGINNLIDEIDFSGFKENSFSELLKNALEEKGVGAKTAAGYGYLQKEKENHFPEYEKLLQKEKEKIEMSKPLWQKIIENNLFSDGINYIKNNKEKVNDVIDMLKINFQKETLWEKKKSKNQHFDFANLADEFLEFTKEKDETIISFIKKFGGKNFKKKYKSATNSQTNIKLPANIKEIEPVMELIEKNIASVSLNEFEKIEHKINSLIKKDKKKNKMKSNKKSKILTRLSEIRKQNFNS